MRAYFFGNMYLSSIQQGIQAGHVIGEMAVKYRLDEDVLQEQSEMFIDWAKNHKVMILLSAGYGENIEFLEDLFEGTNDYNDEPRLSTEYDGYSPYPFAIFRESDEALGGAATSFGVILPAKIYKGAEAMRKIKRRRMDDNTRLNWDNQRVLTIRLDKDGPLEDVAYTDWEVCLMERLGQFGLAK